MASSSPEDLVEDAEDGEATLEVYVQWQGAGGSQTAEVCLAMASTLAELKSHCAQMLNVQMVHCPDFNEDMDSQQLGELGIGRWGSLLVCCSCLASACCN